MRFFQTLKGRTPLGKLAYRLYFKPRASIEQSWREGGPIEQYRTEKGRRAMVQAVDQLPPLKNLTVPSKPLEVHFLTGRKYWYQTCFCLYSMCLTSGLQITPVLHDDGTFDDEFQSRVRKLFPWAKIRTIKEIEAHLDERLPVSRYPTLRDRRIHQPLLRKLTDLHAGHEGWKLLLDSDMLFFKRPDFLLEYLQNPQKPCYMVDVFTAYGYPHELRYELVRKPIAEKINIGIFGWKSEELDVDQLEYWVKTLLERAGTHYNLTQGLCSMLLAGRECAIAPEKEYLVLPDKKEGANPTAILHHYVAESKCSYFRHGWKIVMEKALAQ